MAIGNGTNTTDVLETISSSETWLGLSPFWLRVISTAILILVAVSAVKLTDKALTRSAMRIAKFRKMDEFSTRHVVARTKPILLLVTLVSMLVVVLGILGIWGLENAFSGLLAGAGFAGIVIGLAAGDTIGDVVAGFLIFYNNPFQVGDWVEVDGVEGIVAAVGLGATTLTTFDNEKVTIPNRLVEGQRAKNFSHQRKLRRRLFVGVEYGSDIAKALEILESIAHDHPFVQVDPSPIAVARSFGNSSVDLELRYFTEPVRRNVILTHSDMIQQVHSRFRQAGIGIAFPHMQLVTSQEKPLHLGQEARPPS